MKNKQRQEQKISKNGGERAGVSTNQTTENRRKARNCGRTVRPPCGASAKGPSERSNAAAKQGMHSRSVAQSVRPCETTPLGSQNARHCVAIFHVQSSEREAGTTTVFGRLTSRELKLTTKTTKTGREEGGKQGKCKDRATCELEALATLREARWRPCEKQDRRGLLIAAMSCRTLRVGTVCFESHLSLAFFREFHEAEIFPLRNSHLRDVAVLGAGVTDVRFRGLGRDALDVDRARCKLRHGWSVAAAAAAVVLDLVLRLRGQTDKLQ